jgi:methionyl-tRNA formyltransferase
VAPIPWTILAGDRETGVATIRMDEGVDTGDLLLVERTPVGEREDQVALAARLAGLGALLVARTAAAAAAGTLVPRPQGERGATYAPRFTKEHGSVDWSRPAAWLDRQIRAVKGWPGARAMLAGEPIEIVAAEPGIGHDAAAGAPGAILALDEEGMTVATGAGGLVIRELKPAGKRVMSPAAFARGRKLQVGARWESFPGAEVASAALVAAEGRCR